MIASASEERTCTDAGRHRKETTMATAFHTVMFVSRHKDNEEQSIENFRPRCEQHVAKLEVESLDTLAATARDKFGAMFDRFVSEGIDGETSRMYVTLNGADSDRCLKELAIAVLQDKIADVTKVNATLVSIVARPEMATTKRWLFDADCDIETARIFADRVDERLAARYGADSPNAKCSILRSKNNFAIVTNARFDARGILDGFPDIELKREASLFCEARTK